MSLLRPLVARRWWWLPVGVAVSVGAYYVQDHWRRISTFPPEVRTLLRKALRAERRGVSSAAERHFHEALGSSVKATGHDSVWWRGGSQPVIYLCLSSG